MKLIAHEDIPNTNYAYYKIDRDLRQYGLFYYQDYSGSIERLRMVFTDTILVGAVDQLNFIRADFRKYATLLCYLNQTPYI